MSSHTIIFVPSARAPRASRNPNLPSSTRSTATSAPAPTLRCPSSGRLICVAGLIVDIRITSASGTFWLRIFDITLVMSFMPAFMLPVCRSVEIESGTNPC